MLDQQITAPRLSVQQSADLVERGGVELTPLRVVGRRPVAAMGGSAGGWGRDRHRLD
jgi:hypothetical protein